jgi:hypothetical protein
MSPASTHSRSPSDVEQPLTRSPELNEQILEEGPRVGIEFRDAHEQTLNTSADHQTKAADATGMDLVSDIARAQADFMRTVTDSYAAAARDAQT